jgi:hypothetical protein
MNGNFTLGHCKIYPPTSTGPIPPFNGYTNRFIRDPDKTGPTLHTIAASDEEFVAVCTFLARRRARTSKRGRGKAVPNHQAK